RAPAPRSQRRSPGWRRLPVHGRISAGPSATTIGVLRFTLRFSLTLLPIQKQGEEGQIRTNRIRNQKLETLPSRDGGYQQDFVAVLERIAGPAQEANVLIVDVDVQKALRS